MLVSRGDERKVRSGETSCGRGAMYTSPLAADARPEAAKRARQRA
ncbi:hypothetical protein A7982_12072 [Minicystis rosea]|nr:hypothetical protein A7982_12072 [Minicystis rosea]